MRTSIIIVDDHPLIRKGLKLMIESEPDYKVIGQAQSSEEAYPIIKKVKPDLVIVDISLPGLSGLELIKLLLNEVTDLKIMVLSRHDESIYAERVIRAGAKAYLMKHMAGDLIIEAIEHVMNGGIYVSENMNEKLLRSMTDNEDEHKYRLSKLSDRELEIFDLTGRGMTNKEIAERLFLSVKTVESYRTRIRVKLHLKNYNDLVLIASQWVDNEKII
ncbi:MAG TPA: response regulator transcription factor [Balneolales bacterium]|nr:response regulator transcription factor [Balneolales bacterium]